MNLFLERIPSPLGTILLVSDGSALRALDFADCEERMHRLLRRHYRTYALMSGRSAPDIAQRIQAYFQGDLAALMAIPIRTHGSVFQRRVWMALRHIPPGTTMTYGHLAAAIGAPAASRAVGLANGANPVALVVPCHRVIGADGTLTGYGGGLWRKKWLIAHEAKATCTASESSNHEGHADNGCESGGRQCLDSLLVARSARDLRRPDR